jgi:hypothetical protein
MTELLPRFLFAADPMPPLPTTFDGTTRRAMDGTAPVLIAIAVVVISVAVWAAYFRKSDRDKDRGRISDKPSEGSGRRRRRRTRKTQRNPTLAETGGLPPIGSGDSKPPPNS